VLIARRNQTRKLLELAIQIADGPNPTSTRRASFIVTPGPPNIFITTGGEATAVPD
jgi:hypothetical protein